MCGRHVLPYVVDEPIYEIDYPEDLIKVEKALHALAKGISICAVSDNYRLPV